MSNTIDERVVQMQFQNGDFERNAGQSIKTLGKLDDALELKNGKKSFADVEAAAEKTKFSSLINAVEQVSSKFSALGIMGVTALTRIANAAISTGTSLIKSLTIDPISQGYQEYELKIGSIQTMLASTGESLDTVKGYLEELNEYADQTIYSFSDMTQNIGKFTNAGVNLKDAVAAIKGVSNVAAVSGANTNEASRAMYNFAQALSAGYVKLIDWKSIENANMATVEFKQQLIDTAVALGTVTEEADGMYKTLSGKTFNATKNFNDVLQEQWMTTDVLVQTLGDYADATTEIGQKAYEAATKVRTFSKLLDTLKEAVGSGWAMTAEYIIGDYDQATEVWTKVNDTLSEVISKSSDARNSLLKVWNEGMFDDEGKQMRTWNTIEGYWSRLTGREAVIQGLSNVFQSMTGILGSLGSAFDSVFRKLNAQDLIQASYAFLSFSRTLKLSTSQLDSLKRGFTGIFNVIKKLGSVVGSAISALSPLTKIVSYVGNNALTAFGKLGDKLTEISKWDSYKSFFSAFESGLDTVTTKLVTAADAVKKFFGGLFEGVELPRLSDFFAQFDGTSNLTQGLSSAGTFIHDLFSGLGSGFSNAFSGFSLDNLASLIGTGGLTALTVSLTGFVDTVKDSLDSLGDVVGEGGVLGTLRETLKSFQSQVKAKAIREIAISVGILAASLLVLSMVKPERLVTALLGLAGALVGLVKTVSIIGKIVSSEGFNLKGFIALASALIPLAAAVLILSAAVRNLAELDWNGLIIGLTGLAGICVALSKTASYLNSSANGLKISAIGYIGLATSILILSSAVAKFGNLDLAQLAKGLAGVAASFAIIAGFTKIADTAKISAKVGAGLIAIAASMLIFASAIATMGEMDVGQALLGLSSMTAILAAIAGFSVIIKKFGASNMLSLGASLILVGAAMNVLAAALETIGSMSLAQVGTAILGMAGSLLVLAAAMAAFSMVKSGTVAMIGAAAALLILTPALTTLGQLSLSQVGIGLLAIAGAFTVLGVAGLLLTPLAPTILVLAGALALMGVGVLATGAGITALAAGIAALAAAFAGGATVIADGIVAVVTGLGNGIVQMAAIIAQGAPTIGAAVVSVVLSILVTLRVALPAIVEIGLEMILALLSGINNNIGQIVIMAVLIVVNFVNGIAASLDLVVQSAIDLVISFVNAVADGIRDNSDQIFAALGNLLSSVLELLISGLQQIVELIPGIGPKISEKLEGAKASIRETLAPESLTDVGTEAGKTVGNNISEGVTSSIDLSGTGEIIAGQVSSDIETTDFSTVGATCGTQITSSMLGNIDFSGAAAALPTQFSEALAGVDMSSVGTEFGAQFTTAVTTGMTSTENVYAVTEAGKTVTNNANSGAQSVDTETTGAYIVDGMVNGINNNAYKAIAAAQALAEQIKAIIASASEVASPSKFTMRIGNYIVEGLAIGLEDNTYKAVHSASKMASKTVAALEDALNEETGKSNAISPVLDMSAIYEQIDSIGDDEDWNPVIKPVLDLSRVNPGLKNLNAIVSTKAQNAADEAIQNGSANTAQNIWSPTFNQYNNSPKALSRTEIYRQTKNQFSALKGVMIR